jgi:hypothetical protein
MVLVAQERRSRQGVVSMIQPWRRQQAVRSRALMPVLSCSSAWTSGHGSGD